MTFGLFILGAVMMVVGILATWKTSYFLQYFGDLGEMLGAANASWLSWKVFGVFLIVLGFLIAFDLFQLFFYLTIGQFFVMGGQ